MDSLLYRPMDVGNASNSASLLSQAKAEADYAALKTIETPGKGNSDALSVKYDEIYKSLALTAKQVIEKLNELLQTELPNGIQSLDPTNQTPEATADRIVRQVTGFFSIYAKQNPDLEGEELLNSYMDTIRLGVEEGYEDAFQILEGLGAFEFDGVQDGVELTKELIEEKLVEFEEKMRGQMGLETENPIDKESIKAPVTQDLLAQGGASVLHVIV